MTTLVRRVATLAIAIALTTGAAVAQSIGGGQNLYATMQTPLDSKTANPGDRFTMAVIEPYPTDADLTGATIEGHVSNVVRAGQGTKPEIDLTFDRFVYPDGASVPINANLISLQSKTGSKNGADVAAKTVGGMFLGNALFKTLFHAGGGGLLGAIGGFIYGQNAKADVAIQPGSQAELNLAAPIRPRRQATE
jgi:hypothetical protein